MNMNKTLQLVLLAICGLSTSSANAAITLDRTRVIFPGENNSISVKVSNNNKELPYLAQTWLEDVNGNKVTSPFVVLPPIQRVEPDTSTMIQIRALPAISQLPQDKESLFYFNVREVPPKSEKVNVLQFALQTKVKFFYRPQALVIPAGTSKAPWQEKLILKKNHDGYSLDNPTPYFITIVEAATSSKSEALEGFESLMLAPKSSSKIKLNNIALGATPSFTYINDFGGRSQLNYHCGTSCELVRTK